MSLRLGTCDTLEEAKQFAQSDIERHVLASLETYRSCLLERPDPTTPPLMQLIERRRAMHLNLPRYDSATVAETLTKALEGLLTLPPEAMEEHQRLDQILHEIAEIVERTSPTTAEAMSDALDAALKEAREAVAAAEPRPDDFPPEVVEAVQPLDDDARGQEPGTGPDPVAGYTDPSEPEMPAQGDDARRQEEDKP